MSKTDEFEQLKKLQANLTLFTKRKESYEAKIKDLNNRIKEIVNRIAACEQKIRCEIMSEILGDVSFEEVIALQNTKSELNNILCKVLNNPEPHKLLSKIDQICQEPSHEHELQETNEHRTGGVR